MPNYDYRCRDCGRKATIYQSYEEYGQVEVECPHCESHNLDRLVNRVRIARSEESRFDSLADPSALADLDENDPKSLARAMRSMSDELGEEMPAEFDEVVGRLEAGESPEEIEKSMPELDDDFGGDLDF
ncbi:MAG: FmdB family zinc ribbon protein [Anaerolineales bacterium]